MPDRTQHELRGPVRICLEERSYPGAIAADGTQRAEGKYSYQTEFDVDGRLLETRGRNSDGSEWITRSAYDGSGRLLKFTSGKDGGSMTETIHSYDAQGRPLSITSSDAPDNPITFRYDERGRKSKLQISRPEDYRPNTAVGGSPFQAADMRAPNLPGGGSATTIYDELDRPIEVQVRDSQGNQ